MNSLTPRRDGFRSPKIVSAKNDLYLDEDGVEIIDMFGANGCVLLGHGHSAVKSALNAQIEAVWNTGSLATDIREFAEASLSSLLGSGYRCLGLYSTGMEAVEFVMRVARSQTGKPGIVGFDRAMHGKSMAAAQLAWDNNDGIDIPNIVRLPDISRHDEAHVLEELQRSFSRHQISAVFVEPMHASAGGYCASTAFHKEVQRLCNENQSLLVYDEILTGCFRTGPGFMFESLHTNPDLIVIGKALGNGFPVSAVMSSEHIHKTPQMLAGSTFSGNPLASAVAGQVANCLQREPPTEAVELIGRTIGDALNLLPNVSVHGRGALWIVTLATAEMARRAAEAIYRRGTLVGQTGPYLRLLPPVTITKPHLKSACDVLRDVLAKSGTAKS